MLNREFKFHKQVEGFQGVDRAKVATDLAYTVISINPNNMIELRAHGFGTMQNYGNGTIIIDRDFLENEYCVEV